MMTSQRLISDARRRARALSVETGRPYQSHLDDVARLCGREDWKTFVADPSPLPASAPSIDEACTRSPTSGPDVSTSHPRRRTACVMGALALAALPAMAAAALLRDVSRANEASAYATAEATMLAHVRSPYGDVASPRTMPARIEDLGGTRRRVTLLEVDMRVYGASPFLHRIPGYQGIIFVGDRLGGRRMQDALAAGAVMRTVLEVDCTAGTMRIIAHEAASNMTAPADFVQPTTGRDRAPAPIRTAAAATDMCTAEPTPRIDID